MIDCRFECDPANWSHICIFPILLLRCREADREEVVYSLLSQPLDPREMATRQPLSDGVALTGIVALLCDPRHNATSFNGCALSRLHSLRSSFDGCALSRLHSLRSSFDGCALSRLHSLRSSFNGCALSRLHSLRSC